MSGILYGIGVGPGDPDLLTLKAARLIASADLIAYPVNPSGDSLARRIAAGVIPEGAAEYGFSVPMTVERAPAKSAYDVAAARLAEHLSGGQRVALLCEGDPFFYGSFMYLFARLAHMHQVEVVPGVSSLTASAAMLGRPLAARDDTLKVLPATLDGETLRRELQSVHAAAIIKVGRHFEKVRGILDDLGLSDTAMIVESATLPEQKVTPVCDVAPGARPYFSTILIYQGGEAW